MRAFPSVSLVKWQVSTSKQDVTLPSFSVFPRSLYYTVILFLSLLCILCIWCSISINEPIISVSRNSWVQKYDGFVCFWMLHVLFRYKNVVLVTVSCILQAHRLVFSAVWHCLTVSLLIINYYLKNWGMHKIFLKVQVVDENAA
jgi:hypothetical protein